MTANAILQVVLYFGLMTALAIPIGLFMARAAQGEGLVAKIFNPVERAFYKLAGVDADDEMDWRQYAKAVTVFSLFCVLVVYALQRLQAMLPLNPVHLGAVEPGLAFNTAVSFTSNTNWQAYGGETTLSFLVQMLGLTVQNFVSASVGIAVLYALARAFTRKETDKIGNFWVDLTRIVLHVFLPLSFAFALVLVARGVPQTLTGAVTAQTIEAAAGADGKPVTAQTLSLGPAASQIAVKQLGTNGGGFYNVNSSHPYENPTPFTNLLECLAILLIPGACVFAFGRMISDRRQAVALYATMLLLSVPLVFAAIAAEQRGNPALDAAGADQAAVSADGAPGAQSGGNMEGKEVRYGITESALWAVWTTDASNGSVNSMHDSYTPLGGLITMINMQLGEVVFGGTGCGLYGLLLYAIIAVFIAGLMVGRTPEYLGKKLEAYEMKWAAIGVLLPALFILGGTALALKVPSAAAAVANPGAHGYSEILYAFSSAAGNNGSAFAGLTASGWFLALAHAVAMWACRFWPIVAVLAIAGSLAAKKKIPESTATLPTHTPLFVVLLAGTVVLIGLLTFVPALALGPLAEHFMLFGGAP